MTTRHPRRGRLVLLVCLGFFLVVTAIVTTRQQRAIRLTRERSSLERKLEDLLAQHADLRRRTEDAAGPGVLLPRVAAMQLHLPVDTQFVVVRRPVPPRRR